MKKILLIIILLFALMPSSAQQSSSDHELIEAEATITSLESKVRKRGRYVSAEVEFKTEEGEKITGSIGITTIPIIGSFKSVGDKLDIVYQKDNPGVFRTPTQSFLAQYSWPLMIIFLVLFFGYWMFYFIKHRARYKSITK